VHKFFWFFTNPKKILADLNNFWTSKILLFLLEFLYAFREIFEYKLTFWSFDVQDRETIENEGKEKNNLLK